MREKWHNTDDINERLGDSLNVDQAWEKFGKRKNDRGIVFWFKTGMVLFLFLSISILSFFYFNGGQDSVNDLVTQTNKNTQAYVESNIKNQEKSVNKEQENSSTSEQDQSLVVPKQKKQNQGALQKEFVEPQQIQDARSKPKRDDKGVVEPAIETLQAESVGGNQKVDIEKDSKQVFFKEDIQETRQDTRQELSQLAIESQGRSPEAQTQAPLMWQGIDLIAHKAKLLSENNIEAVLPHSNSKTMPLFEMPPHLSFWQLGIGYAYNIPQRKLSGGDSDYNLNRKNGEQLLESQSLALEISRTFSKHFYIAMGLGINQYRSKIVNQIQLIESELLEDQVIEIRTKNGDDTHILGSVIATNTTLIEKTRYQRYRNWSIPIEMGVQLSLNKNWYAQMGMGLNYGLYHQAKGSTFDAAYATGNYQSLSEKNYRTHGLLEGTAQLKVGRTLGNKLHILFGLNAQKDLNNRMTSSGDSVDKFSSWGTELGVYRRF